MDLLDMEGLVVVKVEFNKLRIPKRRRQNVKRTNERKRPGGDHTSATCSRRTKLSPVVFKKPSSSKPLSAVLDLVEVLKLSPKMLEGEVRFMGERPRRPEAVSESK